MSIRGEVIKIIKEHITAEGNWKNIDLATIDEDSNLVDSGCDHHELHQIIGEKWNIAIPWGEGAPGDVEPSWKSGRVGTIIETVTKFHSLKDL